MNKRKFFKSLGAIVAGTYLACHVKALELIEKVQIINPEYLSAPYEVSFIYNKELNFVEPSVFRRCVKEEDYFNVDKFPIRFDMDGKVVSPIITS